MVRSPALLAMRNQNDGMLRLGWRSARRSLSGGVRSGGDRIGPAGGRDRLLGHGFLLGRRFLRRLSLGHNYFLGRSFCRRGQLFLLGLYLDPCLIQFLLRGRSPLLQRFSQIAPDGTERLRLLSQGLIVTVGSESARRVGQRIHNVAESIHVAVELELGAQIIRGRSNGCNQSRQSRSEVALHGIGVGLRGALGRAARLPLLDAQSPNVEGNLRSGSFQLLQVRQNRGLRRVDNIRCIATVAGGGWSRGLRRLGKRQARRSARGLKKVQRYSFSVPRQKVRRESRRRRANLTETITATSIPLNNTKVRARKIAHSHFPATRGLVFVGCSPNPCHSYTVGAPGTAESRLRKTPGHPRNKELNPTGLLCEAADSESERPALERKIEN